MASEFYIPESATEKKIELSFDGILEAVQVGDLILTKDSEFKLLNGKLNIVSHKYKGQVAAVATLNVIDYSNDKDSYDLVINNDVGVYDFFIFTEDGESLLLGGKLIGFEQVSDNHLVYEFMLEGWNEMRGN